MEYAFKHMDQCMEEMNSDYRSAWKGSNRFSSGFRAHNGFDGCSNEAEFCHTLKNGEFFEKWHYQDQRMWRLEQSFMEMAGRMNFPELETQMQSAMQNNEAMLSMSQSWMGKYGNYKGIGNNYMFSKNGSYGNNYGFGNSNSYNMSNSMNNWNIMPPSG